MYAISPFATPISTMLEVYSGSCNVKYASRTSNDIIMSIVLIFFFNGENMLTIYYFITIPIDKIY